jgi:hypothetical protein
VSPHGASVVVGEAVVVLCGVDAQPEFVVEVRRAVGEGDPVGALLTVLARIPWRTLPSFGCAIREVGSVRVFLRGAIAAEVIVAQRTSATLAAVDVATWVEHSVDGVEEVILRDEASGTSVTLIVGSGAVVSDDSGWEAEQPAESGRLAAPGGDPVAPPPPASVPIPIDLPEAVGGELEDFDFSHLLQETRYPDVEAAAVRPIDVPEEPPAPEMVTEPPGSKSAETILPNELLNEASDGPKDQPATLIDGVPFSSVAAATNPEPVAVPAIPTVPSEPRSEASKPVPGDHDGHTISIADVRRLAEGALVLSSAGPEVQAVRCPSGHLNPPHAHACRVCGVVIEDRAVTTASRPSLGELRFDDGQVVPLDRGVLVGRKPVAPSIQRQGGLVPHLVTLDDPDRMLSRVHLEVRLEDWQVSVIDQDSRNGTSVEIPGRSPITLRPGEPQLISPGTRTTLGDGMAFVFEVPQP